MSAGIDLSFPHAWEAEVLGARPAILPARHFVYPREVEEIERGALEVLIRPRGSQPFLATCALGFRDPAAASGVWAAPDEGEICCVAGGYSYVINIAEPERFAFLEMRPVLEVRPVPERGLLLFVGHRGILAWGVAGLAWRSPKLSDEGVTVTAIEGNALCGLGWSLITDKEASFKIDLGTGQKTGE